MREYKPLTEEQLAEAAKQLPKPFTLETKGLVCSIYRPADNTDYTNGGITSVKHGLTDVLLVEAQDWIEEIEGTSLGPVKISEAAGFKQFPLRLVRRNLIGRNNMPYEYLHAEPLTPEGTNLMLQFGGNFIHSHDSRFPNRYPIPVHDRRE